MKLKHEAYLSLIPTIFISIIYGLITSKLGFIEFAEYFIPVNFIAFILCMFIFRKTSLLHFGIFIFLSTTVSFISFRIGHRIKKNEVKEVIIVLENYKKQHGKYPQKLKNLPDYSNFPEISYRADSTQQSFSISYDYDGFSNVFYGSEEKIWTISD
jgi:hypothetical protein